MEYITTKLLIYVLTFFSVALIVGVCTILLQQGYWAYEKRVVETTERTLAEIFIFMDPKRLFVLKVLVTPLFMLLGLVFLGSIFYVVLFGVFGFFLPRFLIWQLKRKRFDRFADQFVDGLMVLTNAMRSGMSFIQSMEVVEQELSPPVSQEFGLVVKEIRLGVSTTEALNNLTQRVPNDDLKLVVSSINVVAGLGGNLPEMFETISLVVRERTKIELKTKSLTSQGRLQAVVVGLLPMGLGIVMYIIDPVMMNRMLTTAIGNVALATMFALEIAAYLLIRKITTIEV